MGVPAFFRWLSRKYPQILVYCHEETPKEIDGEKIPTDTSQPNPNNIEFDNLYLDMNGIIHPCCHPEDRPAPRNEDEMMVLIFEYIDRLFAIVRPRRLLYMAIDGVAPRAKMNQQRSRRFRASKEAQEKQEAIDKVRSDLEMQGIPVPPKKSDDEHFDSNCITPGTPFMARLAECLRFYIHDRLNNDPGWRNIEVILSDANVPGEGEHKIMDYIRRQRASPGHDPNTHHCLCGADADLIMLGLATHEPNFTIIREEFIPFHEKPCDLCGQFGHDLKDCQGLPRDENVDDEPLYRQKNFIFLRISVLREYLEKELTIQDLPFTFDLERAIDDWVFMCFFVGNDFLPHLPSLEIRENAIDRLVNLYKRCLYKTRGWLTDSGHVNLDKVQFILSELGAVEDEIFQVRHQGELDRLRREKDRKRQKRDRNNDRTNRAPAFVPQGQFAPVPIGSKPAPLLGVKQTAIDMRRNAMTLASNTSNADAAKQLKAMLKPVGDSTEPEDKSSSTSPNSKSPDKNSSPEKKDTKRKQDEMEPEVVEDVTEEEEDEFRNDEVRLWEDGWKERYYQAKFEVSSNNLEFRYKVAAAYAEGLCWVLQYYYQGVPSWKWFFPYHYAPFASDFVNVGSLKIEFATDTQPFKPLEQLMGVFPAGSKKHVPEPWAKLMIDVTSPIIDFYPEDFKVDLNGKKFAWQGVALLPFVDEIRLLKALALVYDRLTEGEIQRNVQGVDRLFVGGQHRAFRFLTELYEDSSGSNWVELDGSLAYGMSGTVKQDEFGVLPGKTVQCPLPKLIDIDNNQAICVAFRDPQFPKGYVYEAKRLPGAVTPEPVLHAFSYYVDNDRVRSRPQTGFSRNLPRATLDVSGKRMLNRNVTELRAGSYEEEQLHRERDNRGRGGGRYYNNRQQTSGYYVDQSYGRGGGGGYNQSWNYQMQQQSYAFQQSMQQQYFANYIPPNPYQDNPPFNQQHQQGGSSYGNTGGYWRPPVQSSSQPRQNSYR